MKIILNGEERVLDLEQASIEELIQVLGLEVPESGIAIALNLSVVSRSSWSETAVNEGDEVDILIARQGG